MPYPTTSHGTNVTKTYDVASTDPFSLDRLRAELGFAVAFPATEAAGSKSTGTKCYALVHNDTGAAWTVGQIIMRKDATSTFIGKPGIAADHPIRFIGVAETAIPAGWAGWVVTDGLTAAEVGVGGATADAGMLLTAAGAATNVAAATDATFGFWLATSAVVGAVVAVYVKAG